jgi:hypothetical protein
VNAKVTTWWKTGGQKATVDMPEHMVADYLAGLPKDELKGYIVDTVPSDIKPRVPFEAGDEVVTESGRTGVFIGTDPKYPDQYVVRLTGFRADYVLLDRETLHKA